LGNRRSILIGTTLVVIASAVAIPQFRFNDNFVEYFAKQSEFRSATEWATEHVAGILQIHYSLPAGEPGGIANPEYLNELDEFAKWYRGQSDVVHVSSFSDIIKRVNKSMHADDPSYYAIPENRELAAQYLLLYEMSVPYGLDVNDQVDVDKSATRLTVTFQNWETERLEMQLTQAQKWFDEHAPALTAPATGIGIMFTFIGKNNYEDMKIGTVLAFMLISAVVMLALRNIKLGLISILTNFAPPIVALGLLALFTTEVGLWANVFIVTSLGLIVDATVHFLFKYNYARVENHVSPQDAVRYTFSTVGAPLLVTSLILIMGFCVLALSAFVPNTMLGILVSTTIAVALALDFLLLPALLISIDRTTQESVPRIDSSVQGINS